MKRIIFYCFLILSTTSCVQKFSRKDLIPKDLPKEVPELVLTKYREERKTDSNRLYNYSTPRFFISKHEITNKQFCDFLNEDSICSNKEWIKSLINLTHKESKIYLTLDGVYQPVKGAGNYPVVLVSWWGARDYCIWLNAFVDKQREQKGLYRLPRYRLPSEFEWLSATAVNSVSQWSYDIEPVCNSQDTSGESSVLCVRNVKKDACNSMGIAGMNENVCEWTNDDFYANTIIMDFSISLTYYETTDSVVVRKHGFFPNQKDTHTCGRVSRFRSGFYSDTGFRIVQTYIGRSTGAEF